MKLKESNYPLVKLPRSLDLTLYLIREELRSQKFFIGLNGLGLHDCPYQTHLGKAILQRMGLDDGKDETFEFYYGIIEKRSKKIGETNESVMKQVMKVYSALLAEKLRRKIAGVNVRTNAS